MRAKRLSFFPNRNTCMHLETEVFYRTLIKLLLIAVRE